MSFKERIPPLSIIVAVDEDGGFAKDGKIPWSFPEDLKHFQSVTKGNVCIMGRRTYTDMVDMMLSRRADDDKEIVGPILKGRESYVVTSNEDFECPGATAVRGIHQAIQCLTKEDTREVFVIGGEQMYIEALAFTQTIYMTIVKGKSYDCNKFFPIRLLNKKSFKIAEGSETDDLRFITYKRIK